MSYTNVLNSDKKTRFLAILDFFERMVKRQLPSDMTDVQTDGPFMAACVAHMGSKLRYLVSRAGAATLPEFQRLVLKADSVRVVRIDTQSKGMKQQRVFHCDACGREEHCCGYAIDVAGKNNDVRKWFQSTDDIQPQFERFMAEYRKRFDQFDSARLLPCDMGRFFVGKTCLRKATLQYMTSTLFQEILYNFSIRYAELTEEERASNTFHWATEEEAEQLETIVREIELCIVDEKRPLPDLSIDPNFWEIVDEARAQTAANDGMAGPEQIVKRRARASLEMHKVLEAESAVDTDVESNDEFLASPSPVGSDDDGSDADEEQAGDDASFVQDDEDGDDEVEVGLRRRGKARTRSRVLAEEEEEEGEQGEVHEEVRGKRSGGRATRATQRKRASHPPLCVRRSKRVRRKPAFFTIGGEEGQEEEEEKEEEEAEAEAEAEVTPSRRVAPASAASIATSLRVPSADGTPGPLGSRKSALLDLMSVQMSLVQDGKLAEASKLSRAILTFQELLERVSS